MASDPHPERSRSGQVLTVSPTDLLEGAAIMRDYAAPGANSGREGGGIE